MDALLLLLLVADNAVIDDIDDNSNTIVDIECSDNGKRLEEADVEESPQHTAYCQDLLATLQGLPMKPETSMKCELKDCKHRSKYLTTATLDPRDSFITHAKNFHREEFVRCQYQRLVKGELPVPEEILMGPYLLQLMLFICDPKKYSSKCMIPNCSRWGADRHTGFVRPVLRASSPVSPVRTACSSP